MHIDCETRMIDGRYSIRWKTSHAILGVAREVASDSGGRFIRIVC